MPRRHPRPRPQTRAQPNSRSRPYPRPRPRPQAFHTDMLSRVPAIGRLPPHVLIEFVSQLKPYYFVEGGWRGRGWWETG